MKQFWTLVLLLCTIPPSLKGAPVMLQQFEMYANHDLPWWTPHVYFRCQGEPLHKLTGVTHTFRQYNFTMHESFQPLTTLEPPKCKKCGFYEADTWKSDDAFDEWELCPLDFTVGASGRLQRRKQGEFEAVFVCPHCNDNLSTASGREFSVTVVQGLPLLSVLLIAASMIAVMSAVAAGIILWVSSGGYGFSQYENSRFLELSTEDYDERKPSSSSIEMGGSESRDSRFQLE